MPRKARNNPRQIRSKSCSCKLCVAAFRPGEKPTRKDCTGSWQARYRDPGGKQRAKTFRTKKQAEAFLDSVRSDVRTGTYIDPGRSGITLATLYSDYIGGRRGEQTTIERDVSSWTVHVEPAFGAWKLLDISHMDVDAWVTRMGNATGRTAVIKAFQLLDRLLAVALRDRRIPFNPCDGIKLPRKKPKHPDDLRPPTYQQLALVREHLPVHYHPLLITAEESGLRWGELTDLRLQNVDFDLGTIQVREVIVETTEHGLQRKEQPKSSAGFRTVPLTGKAADAMREAMRLRRPAETRTAPQDGMHEEELIFRGPLGGVLSRHNFRRLWVSAIQEAGIARSVKNPQTGRMEWWPHVHDIRHTFASRLHDEGVPETTAQIILGHERGAKVTWIYQHAPAEAVEIVRRVLDPGAPRLRMVSSSN